MKVCLVGCGYMATAGHGPSLRQYAADHSDITLAGCCDVEQAKAQRFAEKFGFHAAYTDVQTMLQAEKPDAVSLIVPPKLTAQYTVQLLKAGIPVLLEKPPGMDRAQTLELMEWARRTGTIHQVAFNRRYMPMVQRFRQLATSCPGQYWQYDFYRYARRDADFSTTSIHAIDTLRFLVGQPYSQVRFTYLPSGAGEEYVPTILLDCLFADGQQGRITFVPTSGTGVERCVMHGINELITAELPYHGGEGTSGSIRKIRADEILFREDAPMDTPMHVSNGFYGENAHFLDCVREGRQPEGDIASGLQAVEIAQCIRQRKEIYHS